ncbi:MAG: tRNA (adenosine(37)-N6)-threonylcarbamoyltransferase complex dimerization subunit type 1 TsaB, partial [Bacteroidales bacterium]|nr:tRNA (adenosine(37)-N6)-threonylcarbamoyltransferase complex dimerization subunit type 1 TsaB [Bacteroidales bacterium]
VPVIAVETPFVLAKAALEKHKDCSVITMIDARRMEVYANIFSKKMEVLRDCSADVLTENYYDEFLKEDEKVLLVGDGAAKTKELFANKQNYFYDDAIRLSSRFMATLAWEKYLKNEFVDTAYFEPYYLKDFIAVRSKVKGLR